MHELSIVTSIIEMAREQVHAHNANQVEKIELEVGTLAGIEMHAFNFAWEHATQQSVLSNAERIIHPIQARARCLQCEQEFDVEELYEICTHCGEFQNELIQGKELKLKSLVLINN